MQGVLEILEIFSTHDPTQHTKNPSKKSLSNPTQPNPTRGLTQPLDSSSRIGAALWLVAWSVLVRRPQATHVAALGHVRVTARPTAYSTDGTSHTHTHTHTPVQRPLFRDYQG